MNDETEQKTKPSAPAGSQSSWIDDFDALDQECVRRALAGLGVKGHVIEGGLPFLVAEWEAFVSRVEAGYVGSFHSFQSKLSIRTSIARVFERVPEGLSRRLRRLVEPTDFRYRAVGCCNEDFLLDERMRHHYDPDRFFWLFGAPEGSRFE